MTKKPDDTDKDIGQIMDNAQTLLNFCATTFAKPSEAWFACLVSSAILTAELSVPLDKFLDWFVVSAQACGDDAIGGACSGGFDGMVLDPSSCALVACDVRVGDCGFFNNFDCGVIYARVLVRM